MCLLSVKNKRWQIHLNHFNKDNIKDCDVSGDEYDDVSITTAVEIYL